MHRYENRYDLDDKHWNAIPFTYERLKNCTDNFSEENYLGAFQYGKVYRGLSTYSFPRERLHLLVKIWEVPENCAYQARDNELRLMDEMVLLRHEKLVVHPGMLKLHGYCFERGHIAAVYKIKPLDTVYNLLLKDSFTWCQRIKVALGLAGLLEFLHGEDPLCAPFGIRNVNISHIILDEDFNPKLFDFGLVTGGIFRDRTGYLPNLGCSDIMTPFIKVLHKLGTLGTSSQQCDVFCFGVVLMSLITSQASMKEDLGENFHSWDVDNFNSGEPDIIREILLADPYFNLADYEKIIDLARSCVDILAFSHPTMKEVVNSLMKLKVVEHQTNFMQVSISDASVQERIDLPLYIPPRKRMKLCHGLRVECGDIKKYSYEQLKEFTGNFSEEKFLGYFQFGEVYHGVIKEGEQHQHVMVKVWEVPEDYHYYYHYYSGDNVLRLTDEILLLQHEKITSNRDMIKLCGYCLEVNDEEHFAAVYDFEPMETLYYLIPDDNFTWLQRMRVALGVARLVKFFHTSNSRSKFKPFLIRNISANHIVVDKEYNPKLYDFSMISGGIFPDRASTGVNKLLGCIGYIDAKVGYSGEWSDRSDVFAFGCLLLMLISKRPYPEEGSSKESVDPCTWAYDAYGLMDIERKTKRGQLVFVHEDLLSDSDYCASDGRKVTKLAMKCINSFPIFRPSMKRVVRELSKLRVVKQHT